MMVGASQQRKRSRRRRRGRVEGMNRIGRRQSRFRRILAIKITHQKCLVQANHNLQLVAIKPLSTNTNLALKVSNRISI